MIDIEALLERYYEGTTSLEEERLIKAYLESHPGSTGAADEHLFAGIRALQEQPVMPIPAKRRTFRYFAIAGTSLAAGLALFFVLRHPQQPLGETAPASDATVQLLVLPKVSGEIKDEEVALEQARMALAYVSNKLNKGTAGISQLNQLEKSISKIKNKEEL